MSEESLFREVDEEVRQDQFKKLWDRYGNLILALCFVVVGGVAGFKGWQYWQTKQAEAAGESFFVATKLASTGKSDEAIKAFEAIGQTGYGALARLRTAAALAGSGKPEDAVKAYDAIVADGTVTAQLRDVARVRAAYLLVDTAKPEDLASRVSGLEAAGNTWRHAAREITALSLWRAGDYAGAEKQTAAMLADPETPAGERQRAQMLSELLLPLVGKK